MTISGLMDLDVTLMYRSPRALKVWTEQIGPGVDGVWLPVDLVEITDDDGESLGAMEITLPKWLALDRGLA